MNINDSEKNKTNCDTLTFALVCQLSNTVRRLSIPAVRRVPVIHSDTEQSEG